MIHVLLDTTTYTSDRKRQKGPFRALERLCKGDKVQLHIPYFVKNEYISQQFIDVRSHLAKIRDFAEDIRAITSEDGLHGFASEVKDKAIEMRDGAIDALTKEFEEWMDELGGEEHAVKPGHGEKVAEAYFKELSPFRAVKNRNDFPDAFIWQTILDLAAEHKPLHVVATDKGMYKPAFKIETIKAYKTLEEFIATDECQKALVDLAEETVTENVERAGKLLAEEENELKRMVTKDIINAIHGKTVRSRRIADDNNEGIIQGVYDPHEINFEYGSVEYYGDTDIGVRFEALVECQINYAIFISDYYSLSDEESARISISDLNDHYYDAEETFTVQVTGTLSLTLNEDDLEDEDMEEDALTDAIKHAHHSLEVDEIEIPEEG